MQLRIAALSFLFVAGCSNAPPATNAALGITQFETHETSTELSVVGYNAQHVSVAQLNLRRGYVEIPDEQLAGEGREIDVIVETDAIAHKSVGTMPIKLPLMPSMLKMSGFMTDPYVSAALAKWGVQMEMQHAAAEQQYGSPACGHSINSACGASDCFSNGDDSYEEVCCGSNGDGNGNPAFVVRSCSSPFGTSACGTNGPGGCAPCWNIPYSNVCILWTWPDDTIDYNGPSCQYDYECQGVYPCSTCVGPYDGNGFGSCNIQYC